MSAFTDMVAADLGRLIEDGSDLGVDAVCQPAEGGTSPAIRIVFGDMNDGFQPIAEGISNNRTAPATTRRSTLMAAIGRELQVGDSIVVATGSEIGTWVVTQAVPDNGDGYNMMLRYDRAFTASKVAK